VIERKGERVSSPLARLVDRLRQLEFVFPETARFVRFGAVGASGVLVDCGVTYAMYMVCGSPDVAYLVGIAIAMTWNFFWNRRITFADADSSPLWRQYIGFCGSCSLGAVVSWTTRVVLEKRFELFAEHIVLAVPIGVVAGMMFNYLLCRRWVFRTATAEPQEDPRDEASAPREPNTPPR